ncbi:hypothetical protein [Bacillus sp. AFS031507]|uniref:hypothetical protein n=1 Tax=Bacillus sp. AFS031507 TaxID=2033496 RepID=UPI000BFD140A|nr:hypothetical protein [Bacillus sp. AFS031507]PGY07789.1 hypothetical protein COE25_23300 [Bacillus sp. AFS031507]
MCARLNLTLDEIAKHIGGFDAVTEEINEEFKSGLKESKEYIDSLINNDTNKKKFRFNKIFF